MLLVDSEIRTFLANSEIEDTKQTCIKNGEDSCITNIGYDLRTEYFAQNKKLVNKVELHPGESVFVQSKEIVHFDEFTVGKVFLKNSRIRMGLTMDAPVYQPGHKTKIFFRLTNVSNDIILLDSTEKYAMLTFEQLEKSPDKPYSGTFDYEFSFNGLADYQSAYTDQIKSINGKIENLRDLEKSIYGNILSILAVFVAVFTLLNVNIELTTKSLDLVSLLIFNLITICSISFLSVMLSVLIHKESKPSNKLWWIPLGCFVAIIITLCIF